MRKEEFYVLNSLYNGSIGRAGCTYDVEMTKALNDTDIYNKLVETGFHKIQVEIAGSPLPMNFCIVAQKG